MMSLDLHAATSTENQFIASGSLPIGTRWKLVGEVRLDPIDQALTYIFTITYAARHWPRRFTGTLSADGRTFSGHWFCTSHRDGGEFFFKRLTCEAMRFWPREDALDANRPRELWRFATAAVRDRVRKQLFSRSHIEERQGVRQRYLQIIRVGEDIRPSEKERSEVSRCYLSMTPSEARYYRMVHEYRQRIAPKHLCVSTPLLVPIPYQLFCYSGITCSHCSSSVVGARTICLDCHPQRATLDLCDRPECLGAIVGQDKRADLPMPHIPSHRLVKVRRVVHPHREFGGVYRAAHDALMRAEEALADAVATPVEVAAESVEDDRAQPNEDDVPIIQGTSRASGGLACMGCREQVARPCWYCVECEGMSQHHASPPSKTVPF